MSSVSGDLPPSEGTHSGASADSVSGKLSMSHDVRQQSEKIQGAVPTPAPNLEAGKGSLTDRGVRIRLPSVTASIQPSELGSASALYHGVLDGPSIDALLPNSGDYLLAHDDNGCLSIYVHSENQIRRLEVEKSKEGYRFAGGRLQPSMEDLIRRSSFVNDNCRTAITVPTTQVAATVAHTTNVVGGSAVAAPAKVAAEKADKANIVGRLSPGNASIQPNQLGSAIRFYRGISSIKEAEEVLKKAHDFTLWHAKTGVLVISFRGADNRCVHYDIVRTAAGKFKVSGGSTERDTIEELIRDSGATRGICRNPVLLEPELEAFSKDVNARGAFRDCFAGEVEGLLKDAPVGTYFVWKDSAKPGRILIAGVVPTKYMMDEKGGFSAEVRVVPSKEGGYGLYLEDAAYPAPKWSSHSRDFTSLEDLLKWMRLIP